MGLTLSSLVLAGRLKTYPLPGNQQGYEPQQPIAFSHQLHAGKLEISCLYCHFGAEKSPHAGYPAASVCMTCHRFVTAPQKEVITELLEAQRSKNASSYRLARVAKALRCVGSGRQSGARPKQKTQADCLGKSSQPSGFCVFRSPLAYQSRSGVPELPWSGGDDGPRAPGVRPVDGVVRELPPGPKPRRSRWEANQATD